MEDQFDLRKYLNVLVKHWILIVSITAIAIAIALLAGYLAPPEYEATSAVLITKARAEISLEPKYKTSFERDVSALRQGLIALAKSPSVAKGVIAQSGDQLDPNENDPNVMLSKLRVQPQGDLIQITYKAKDGDKAIVIANSWAKSYESYVNGLYSGSTQPQGEMQTQVDFTYKEYQEKQKAWENYLKNSRIDQLQQQIADMELIRNISYLREQIMSGSQSTASMAANALIFVMYQANTCKATNPNITTPNINVSVNDMANLAVTTNDIDALVYTLGKRWGTMPGQSTSQLQQQINQLTAELEKETAKSHEIENSRDLAWEAYKTVLGKTAETDVAAKSQSTMVQFAQDAGAGGAARTSSRPANIGIAFISGAVTGIIGAFFLDYLQRTAKKTRHKRATTHTS